MRTQPRFRLCRRDAGKQRARRLEVPLLLGPCCCLSMPNIVLTWKANLFTVWPWRVEMSVASGVRVENRAVALLAAYIAPMD